MEKRMCAMTRDEFLYRQLKEDRSLYRGLAFVYGAAALAALVMAYFAYGKSGFAPVVVFASAAIGLGLSAYGSWGEQKRFAAALDEIGDDPRGADTCRTYSEATARIIARTRKPAKTHRQLFIAYGIVFLMLVAGGVFLIVIGLTDFRGGEQTMLLGFGALLVFGGVLLGILTVRSFRNWRAAIALD